ncbi:hypothetical protein, partial [Kutzneria sp. NPDC051319]|uniref:hypothetical protein n=1 Tax=Kutzneria sp. NPDC051319 TaxID=3155047 RepID=UPI003438474D
MPRTDNRSRNAESPSTRSSAATSASALRTADAIAIVSPSTSSGSPPSVTTVGRPCANTVNNDPLFVVTPAVNGSTAT